MLLKTIFYLGAASLVAAKVQFVGINIAGFEFGCLIDGTCPLSSIQPPVGVGPGQMQHFVNDDQMNIFRMPVSWQYLVNNQLGATLNAANLATYDKLMQACLSTGAYCVIDIHNFARFNGLIIGQGGPTDAQFANLWSQLATKYQSNSKVVFGLMNEPHDLDVPTWSNSVQAAVTAIRNTGATAQMILLPGTNFASAGEFVSSGSAAALVQVKNPDGSTTGLILDVHKYLDANNSGEGAECTTDNTADFAIVAAFLRENSRQALVSETGAGHTASSCFTDFCAQNTFLNQNGDVFLGYIAWAAGSFDTNYVLSLTPSQKNGKFVDNAMASQCVLAPWLNAGTAVVTSQIASTVLAASTTAVVSSVSVTTAPTQSATATEGNSASASGSNGAAPSTIISSSSIAGFSATASGASASALGTSATTAPYRNSSMISISSASPTTSALARTSTSGSDGGLLKGRFIAAGLAIAVLF